MCFLKSGGRATCCCAAVLFVDRFAAEAARIRCGSSITGGGSVCTIGVRVVVPLASPGGRAPLAMVLGDSLRARAQGLQWGFHRLARPAGSAGLAAKALRPEHSAPLPCLLTGRPRLPCRAEVATRRLRAGVCEPACV